MNRRQFSFGCSSLVLFHLANAAYAKGNSAGNLSSTTISSTEPQKKPGVGHLIIIGGAEDRKNEMILLSRFVELTRMRNPRIVILTAASTYQNEVWETYKIAFKKLGITHVSRLDIGSRADANSDEVKRKIDDADGVFISGGDQQRLMSTIGGTLTARAIREAFEERGACIGGTSAGAAVMSAYMMAEGHVSGAPGRGEARMSAGLGLVPRVIIDQHFSERQRLGRLLSLVAQAPFLLGLGIDEDTALVIEKGRGIEVLGEGAVTVIDGRNMTSNFFDAGARELLEMINIKMHLLPSGARYYLPQAQGTVVDDKRSTQPTPDGAIPNSLYDVVSTLCNI